MRTLHVAPVLDTSYARITEIRCDPRCLAPLVGANKDYSKEAVRMLHVAPMVPQLLGLLLTFYYILIDFL